MNPLVKGRERSGALSVEIKVLKKLGPGLHELHNKTLLKSDSHPDCQLTGPFVSPLRTDTHAKDTDRQRIVPTDAGWTG